MEHILVKVNGEVSSLGAKPSLETMQRAVGGYIEYSGNFIVNEEGFPKGLPQNSVYPQFLGNVIVKVKGKKK